MFKYSKSHGLTVPDALIAATALINDLEIYTLNKKDFRYIADLKLYTDSHQLLKWTELWGAKYNSTAFVAKNEQLQILIPVPARRVIVLLGNS